MNSIIMIQAFSVAVMLTLVFPTISAIDPSRPNNNNPRVGLVGILRVNNPGESVEGPTQFAIPALRRALPPLPLPTPAGYPDERYVVKHCEENVPTQYAHPAPLNPPPPPAPRESPRIIHRLIFERRHAQEIPRNQG